MTELASFALHHTAVFVFLAFASVHSATESVLFCSRFLRFLVKEGKHLRSKVRRDAAEWRRLLGG